jgi:hypothetical protein
MIMYDVHWKVWRADDKCSEPGVYVLCASEELLKIMGRDEASILYVGCSTCMSGRIGKATKDGDFFHHVLADVVGLEEDQWGSHEWVYPEFSKLAKNRIWNKRWKVLLLYHTLTPAQLDDSKINTWEDALCVHHFFHFGQYPPLNSKVPAIGTVNGSWYHDWYVANEKYFVDSYNQILDLVRNWRRSAGIGLREGE